MKTPEANFFGYSTSGRSGYSLIEFMVSSMILLIISAALFGIMSDVQRTASSQAEMQSILNNAQVALQTIGRYIRQAGNNPLGGSLAAIIIGSPSEVHIQSDLTGSLSPGNPDKGDPDGDINDSGENVAIRHNQAARTIEVVPDGGPAQILAGNISGFSLLYYDADGNAAGKGEDVSRIRVIIRAASLLPNPQTSQPFALEISSDIQLAAWQPDSNQII